MGTHEDSSKLHPTDFSLNPSTTILASHISWLYRFMDDAQSSGTAASGREQASSPMSAFPNRSFVQVQQKVCFRPNQDFHNDFLDHQASGNVKGGDHHG